MTDVIWGATTLGAYVAPTVNWNPDPTLVALCRNLAFFLALLWVVFLVANFAIPKKRQSFGGQGQGARFAMGAVAIILLLDITMVGALINSILGIIWWIGGLFGLGDGGGALGGVGGGV